MPHFHHIVDEFPAHFHGSGLRCLPRELVDDFEHFAPPSGNQGFPVHLEPANLAEDGKPGDEQDAGVEEGRDENPGGGHKADDFAELHFIHSFLWEEKPGDLEVGNPRACGIYSTRSL